MKRVLLYAGGIVLITTLTILAKDYISKVETKAYENGYIEGMDFASDVCKQFLKQKLTCPLEKK